MRIKLPKELKGVSFPRVTVLELNGFDVDLLLPSFFYRVLGEGRGRAKRVNDATDIARYVRRLAHHEAVEGFDGPRGHDLLDRLVRTALIVTGGMGRGKQGEQILAVRPYSLLAHKTGLPSESTRQRNVDRFLYECLRERCGGELALRRFVEQVFGRGVKINPLPALGGRYDGVTPLDTLTRLSVAFLDGFSETPVGRELARVRSEACPSLMNALGWDLQHYLFAYHERMPVQSLTYHLQGLINFELFVYTLKLVHAVNALVRDPSVLPPAMQAQLAPSPPEVYVDFTADPGHLSQRMAAACVRRDLEAYGQFATSVLKLRLLDRYAERLGKRSPLPEGMEAVVEARERSAPEYLQALAQMAGDPRLAPYLDALAEMDEEAIRRANGQGAADEDEEEETSRRDAIGALLPGHLAPLERVLILLVQAQEGQALTGFGKWFHSTGGLSKSHGLLAGTLKGRRAWRYQPSNDLLAIWVQLAALQPTADEATSAGPRPVPLREFLAYLERRFGILVDRPPAPFAGAEAVAAARDNLRAMLRRLRQMGVFRDLSDDFTVQALQPPYAAEEVPV
jgi:hypothetical protein